MIIRLSFFFICISMINFNIAHSFFLANDHSGKIQIDNTTIDSSTQGINGYYIYDNFSHQSSGSFLLGKVDSFVPFDRVKVDIPLRILTRESISPENSVDSILLANLRLKALEIEYRQLQEKIKSLMTTDSLNDVLISKNQSKKTSAGNLSGQIAVIEKRTFEIDRLGVQRFIPNTSNDIVSYEPPPGPDEGSKSPADEISYTKRIPGAKADTISSQSYDFATKNRVSSQRDTTELPFVFRIFLKVLNYILNNRVEFVFYFGFILIVGYFITLQAKQ